MNDIDMIIATQAPALLEIQTESPKFAAEVDALVVDSDATLQQAVDISRRAARWRKMIGELMKPAKRALDEAKRKVLDHEKALLALVDGPDIRIRAKIRTYEDARRREAERIARESKAEAMRRSEEDKLARALRLEQLAETTGDDMFRKAADQELDAPVIPTITQVTPAPPKAEGASFRTVVSVEVFSIRDLARAVADGTVHEAALVPNMTWLRTEARQRGKAYDIPGTLRTESRDVSVRT